MADYVHAAVPVDPDALKADVYDALRAQFPGWEPADGNLDVWIIEAFCEIAAQIGETATFVLRAIFRYFGANLVGLQPIDATLATTTVTFSAIDSVGYTIDEGTTIAWDAGGELVAFVTEQEAVIAPDTASVSGVPVIAVTAGTIGSGLSGTAQLLDPLDFIASVTADAMTQGGLDAETDDAYLNRLAAQLRLMAPRPIYTDDFAVMARTMVPEVARALALNGYDPTTDTFGNGRTVTVFCVNAAGDPISTGGRALVAALFEGDRVVNTLVFVEDPDYTPVDVAFAFTPWDGWDPEDVRLQAEAAVAAYLSPASWGQPTFGETPRWSNETKVRYLEVAQVLQSVEGLRYVDSLSIGGQAAGVDVDLLGPAPLPRPGTITGTPS